MNEEDDGVVHWVSHLKSKKGFLEKLEKTQHKQTERNQMIHCYGLQLVAATLSLFYCTKSICLSTIGL